MNGLPRKLKRRWLDAAAWAALAPVLALPLSNPDLFWHLESARRMLAEGSLPRADRLSFTMLGAPWVDFEWLVQLIFYGAYLAGGWWGLLALKALLLLIGAALIWALADLCGLRGAGRRCALLFWAALSLFHSDLRPDLFSAVLFTAELWVLEAQRRDRLPELPARAWAAGGLLFFAFWANLHAGFPAGFLLLACYLPGRRRCELGVLAAAFGGGVVGTVLNPYGLGVHRVLFEHLRWMGLLSTHILEWRPLIPANPYLWPYLVLLGSAIAVLVLRARRAAPLPGALLAAAALFGVWGLMNARQGLYAVPVCLFVLMDSGMLLHPRRPGPGSGRAAGAGAALWAGLCLGYVLWLGLPDLRRGRPLDARPFPVEAGDFIAAHMPRMRKRRIYNEWGWGGYLGLRFSGDFKVFVDGRYIFHPLLEEIGRAQAQAAAWGKMLDRHGIEWVLLKNEPRPHQVEFRNKKGETKKGEVEHFAVFMSRLKWALVHRDPTARIYVRRGAFYAPWVAGREMRTAARNKSLEKVESEK